MNSPITLIQSILIKVSVFGIGVVLIVWFGWSVPQANQMKFSYSQDHEISSNLEQPAFSSSLDINQGTIEEFQVLPGIGPVLARRIIEHRQSKGPFADIEDLKGVEGIGEKKLTQVRPFISVNQTTDTESQK